MKDNILHSYVDEKKGDVPMYNYDKFFIGERNLCYATSKRYFTHKVLSTEIVQSKKHKINILKNYNARELSSIVTQSGNNMGDFEYNARLFFIMQKLTNTEEFPTYIIGRFNDKSERKMSENYIDFLEEIKSVNKLYINFLVGEDKLKYEMSVDNFLNVIIISTSVFHPEEISTRNILALLNGKINEGIRDLDLIERT